MFAILVAFGGVISVDISDCSVPKSPDDDVVPLTWICFVDSANQTLMCVVTEKIINES